MGGDHGKKDKRLQAEILRDVYEENLRIAGKGPSRRSPPRVRSARGGRLMALVLGATLVLAGGVTYHDLAARVVGGSTAAQPAVAAAPSPEGGASSGRTGPAQRRLLAALELSTAPADYQALLREPATTVADLFGLDVETIVIDPGHGGKDPGASGPTGLQEKEITLAIARRLRQRLTRHHGYKVLLTREADETLALRDRAEFANAHAADLFISIHINWLPVEPVTFVETYYFGPHSDPESRRLAERENDGSGYSVADFQHIVAKIGNTLKLQESRTLAQSIQRSLFRNVRRHNQRILDAGTKKAPFVVLLGVDAPAVLAEVTCLSNREEEKRLATQEYRAELASYLEEGIVRYLNNNANEKKLALGGHYNGT